MLHFSEDTITIPKERYYRLLEIEGQYKAQQQETRRLQQLLEEVIHRFEDDDKVIHLRDTWIGGQHNDLIAAMPRSEQQYCCYFRSDI